MNFLPALLTARAFALILKPLAERFDLLLCIGQEQVLNVYVRGRNQDRLRMGESVKAGLAVVMADAGESNSTERHSLDKQINVHLIDRTSAEGQALQEVVDRFRVTAEEKARKRLRMLLHLTDGGIHILVGEDREK